MSNITSLYIVSRILQVVDVKDVINSVASVVLYPYLATCNLGDAENKNEVLRQDLVESNFQMKVANHVSERGRSCKYSELFFPADLVESSLLDGILRERLAALSSLFSVFL